MLRTLPGLRVLNKLVTVKRSHPEELCNSHAAKNNLGHIV